MKTENIKPVKKVKIPTNLNGKLGCKYFVHLYKLPAKIELTYESLFANIIEWHTEDESHEPVKTEGYDKRIFTVHETPDFFFWMSHGKSKHEVKAQESWNDEDRIAIISYVKI